MQECVSDRADQHQMQQEQREAFLLTPNKVAASDLMQRGIRQQIHKVEYKVSHQQAERDPEYFPAKDGTIVALE